MVKISTAVEDTKILALVDSGWTPKAIKADLKLSNVWRVYDAIRRRKNSFQNFPKNKA